MRSPRTSRRNRYGPGPMGCLENSSSPARSMAALLYTVMVWYVKVGRRGAKGVRVVTFTRFPGRAVTLSTMARADLPMEIRRNRSMLQTTSSALTVRPSCILTRSRILNTRERPPSSWVHDSASQGFTWPFSSNTTSESPICASIPRIGRPVALWTSGVGTSKGRAMTRVSLGLPHPGPGGQRARATAAKAHHHLLDFDLTLSPPHWHRRRPGTRPEPHGPLDDRKLQRVLLETPPALGGHHAERPQEHAPREVRRSGVGLDHDELVLLQGEGLGAVGLRRLPERQDGEHGRVGPAVDDGRLGHEAGVGDRPGRLQDVVLGRPGPQGLPHPVKGLPGDPIQLP